LYQILKTLSIILTDFLQKNERDSFFVVMRKKAISEKDLSFRVSKTIHRLQNYPKKVSMKVNDLMKSQKKQLAFSL